VIQTFKELIEKHGLESQVELKASFCMQKCTKGISSTFDGELIEDLSVNNCEAIFKERIL
jgi:NADH:ubiquinone oxidoreductase subunit E